MCTSSVGRPSPTCDTRQRGAARLCAHRNQPPPGSVMRLLQSTAPALHTYHCHACRARHKACRPVPLFLAAGAPTPLYSTLTCASARALRLLASVQVVLKTASALYECVRPSTSFRKLYAQLEEQLDICHQVSRAAPAACLSLCMTHNRTIGPRAVLDSMV